MSEPIEHVILVNAADEPVGTMEKMEAHEKGVLHRAFSVFLFNAEGHLLLHQRALSKYHSGGLWTNTCCSHPRPGESVLDAAHRRLMEEMGMAADLSEAFSFLYRAELDHGMIEHELDHVVLGEAVVTPRPNPDEVEAYRYVALDALQDEVAANPERFTEWFKICLPEVLKWRG